MSNKTISINPSLFSIGGSKTKKNKEKNSKPTTVPIISPNVLKNKLLKRIKEHKLRETHNLENNKRNLQPNSIEKNEKSFKKEDEILKFNDEFNDSINYLQTLSKQKHINEQKMKNEIIKQKQKEEIERRTIRNYHLNKEEFTSPIINIDLPEELQQTFIQPSIQTEPYKINTPYKGDTVPYGVLKGGLKPSYREWSKTQRSNIVTNPNASLVIQGNNPLKESVLTARENRLNILKEKIKQKNQMKSEPIISQNLIQNPIENNFSINLAPKENIVSSSLPIIPIITQQSSISQNTTIENPQEKIIATKHVTKKTIKRKYLLGRSQTKQIVSILLKDKGTRKKVINAQKDLKRRNINDIKTYLKEHNLIKIGSNAPNDVIRKLYETAMLAGEITNSNSDVLIHNMAKEDKEL